MTTLQNIEFIFRCYSPIIWTIQLVKLSNVGLSRVILVEQPWVFVAMDNRCSSMCDIIITSLVTKDQPLDNRLSIVVVYHPPPITQTYVIASTSMAAQQNPKPRITRYLADDHVHMLVLLARHQRFWRVVKLEIAPYVGVPLKKKHPLRCHSIICHSPYLISLNIVYDSLQSCTK